MLGMPSVSLFLFAAGWAAAAEGATRACPQHLVVMVADQMSYTPDHEGGQAMTPNLDRLREEGVEVKHAYATFPACSPNRAALLTGRYPSTVGVATNRAHHPLPVPGFARDGHAGDVATIAHVLRGQGYTTAWVGKWHLGNGHWDATEHARASGFDVFVDTDADMHRYLHFEAKLPTGQVVDDIPEYQAQWHTDRALAILRAHKAADARTSQNCPQPIALFVSYGPPHHWNKGCDPEWNVKRLEPPTSYCAPYGPFRWGHAGGEGNHTFTAPPTLDLSGEEMLDALMRGDVPLNPTGGLIDHPPATTRPRPNTPAMLTESMSLRRKLAGYFGLVETVDVEVGRILDGMDDVWGEDVARRGAVTCFLTDHGDMLGSHGFFGKHRPQDESVRVPFYIRGPTLRANQTYDGVLGAVDVAPTLLGLLGVPWVPEWERFGLTHEYRHSDSPVLGNAKKQVEGRDVSKNLVRSSEESHQGETRNKRGENATMEEFAQAALDYLDRPLDAVFLMSDDDGIENIKGSTGGSIVWGRGEFEQTDSYLKALALALELSPDDGEDDDTDWAKQLQTGAANDVSPEPEPEQAQSFLSRLISGAFPTNVWAPLASAGPAPEPDNAHADESLSKGLPSSVAALLPTGATLAAPRGPRKREDNDRLQWRAATDGVFKVIITLESWPYAHAVYNMEEDPLEMQPIFVHDDARDAGRKARFQLPLTFGAVGAASVRRAQAKASLQARTAGPKSGESMASLVAEVKRLQEEIAGGRLMAFLVGEATRISDRFVLLGPSHA